MVERVRLTCRACADDFEGSPIRVSQQLLDAGEVFEYLECTKCGTVQIVTLPDAMERYYPSDYRPPLAGSNRVRRFLRRQRWAAIRGSRWNLLGRLLAWRRRRPEWSSWMIATGVSPESRILDVGSSDGALLRSLAEMGFQDLTGIDPFIDGDLVAGPVRIYRRSIDRMAGRYDLVLLDHSLEHVPDPAATLGHVRRLLDRHGWAVVRIPVAGNYGWRTYREHWAGLEAPRHLVVPSVTGMHRVAERAGFRITSMTYDGRGGYYALSEAARAGRRLAGPRRSLTDRAVELVGAQALARFRALAAERNAAADGDTATFYLRPTAD
jgi:SAM-dependent methyltransferase